MAKALQCGTEAKALTPVLSPDLPFTPPEIHPPLQASASMSVKWRSPSLLCVSVYVSVCLCVFPRQLTLHVPGLSRATPRKTTQMTPEEAACSPARPLQAGGWLSPLLPHCPPSAKLNQLLATNHQGLETAAEAALSGKGPQTVCGLAADTQPGRRRAR